MSRVQISMPTRDLTPQHPIPLPRLRYFPLHICVRVSAMLLITVASQV